MVTWVGYDAGEPRTGGRLRDAGFELRLAPKDGARAAALDVFADEPAIPQSLAALPNVVLTPHVGGLSDRAIRAMTEQATGHVLDVLRGQPARAAVANPRVLDPLEATL